MGNSTSKYDGCLMCLFGDGFKRDAAAPGEDVHVDHRHYRHNEPPQPGQLAAAVEASTPYFASSAAREMNEERKYYYGDQYGDGGMTDSGTFSRQQEEVRRIGSLQEEIEWLESESTTPSASTLSLAYPVLDMEDIFAYSGRAASHHRKVGKTRSMTRNTSDFTKAAPSADEGLERLTTPNQRVASAARAVNLSKKPVTARVMRHADSQQSVEGTSMPWPWPDTGPNTPNTDVLRGNKTPNSSHYLGSSCADRDRIKDERVGGESGTRGVHEDPPASFFQSEKDELLEDQTWCQPRNAPSLAELLGRVELLGNVDVALSEVHLQQQEESKRERVIRKKVIGRFMRTMGTNGPGLLVRKLHRGAKGNNNSLATGPNQHGKWADRIIRFEPANSAALSDGTPVGGFLVWNSRRRLFPREQLGVDIADIAKVEHSGKFVWITADGEGKLGLETSGSADAKFLCRSIDFLVAAAVQQHSESGSGASRKDGSRPAPAITGSQKPRIDPYASSFNRGG